MSAYNNLGFKNLPDIRAYDALLKAYLKEGHLTPFNALREQMHLMSDLSYKVSHLPRFSWNLDFSVVQMDGMPIQMAKFIQMTCTLLDECHVRLNTALQGLSFPEFDRVLEKCTNPDDPQHWLRDDLRDISVGYSFVQDKRNGLAKFSNTFLSALLDTESNPRVANKLCLRHANGLIHIKRGERNKARKLFSTHFIFKLPCTNCMATLRLYTTSCLHASN